MGSHLAGWPVHYSPVLCYDFNRLFPYVQALYVYGPCTHSHVQLRRRAYRQYRKKLPACLEGAVIALACIIFSVMAASPPAIDPDVSVVTAVWSYVGELIFNLLVLVGAVRMSDRIVKELLGL